jgi:hypothetical protein
MYQKIDKFQIKWIYLMARVKDFGFATSQYLQLTCCRIYFNKPQTSYLQSLKSYKSRASHLNGILVDYVVIFFALVFYAFLIAVYLLRARQLEAMEWKLSLPFSLQLVPFSLLWVVNLLIGNNSGRLIVELPIIVYLAYDLWYRLITQRKPYHHPQRWPAGLIVYLLLLFAGSIGLNWYGYLVSNFFGNVLVIAFFVMISSYGYYQYRRNRKFRN